tara:strand:+ start:216 stop:443 length:228 start_codon:yes stop_codon:yes gene_type:complete
MTKSLYQKLLPEFKVNLNASARKYSSAKRLKYRLMGKIAWYELSIEDVRSLQTWADIYDRTVESVLYGDNIINKD